MEQKAVSARSPPRKDATADSQQRHSDIDAFQFAHIQEVDSGLW